MVRQAGLIAVVGILLIGCAILLGVGCAEVRSEAPKEEQQEHTEATKQEQVRSPEATASEGGRCEGTRTTELPQKAPASAKPTTTNDLPDCPRGGLLSGTDKPDQLEGKDGDDEIRGLGGVDFIDGGVGKDVIYGGPGDDSPLIGDEGDDVIYGGDGDEGEILDGKGADVMYGGDGNDNFTAFSEDQPDKLYCGKGKDEIHVVEKIDYVDSSCEKKAKLYGIPGIRH